MSLFLIATPIGNLEDITLRALKKLRETKYLIAEEEKILRRRLSAWDIKPQEKIIYKLNEHSEPQQIQELLELTQKNEVCLVTDCGTPSFFDPGFALVQACINNNVPIKSFPGVSSLTALMPYLNKKTERFEVIGFPPQKKEERDIFFQKLKTRKNSAFFILDTPYRLKKTFQELEKHIPTGKCVLGINLTHDEEQILRGNIKEINQRLPEKIKANFVCMLYI